ncbi:MAG: WYL domain-containing protein [Myxococcales bacterium]|nr:WYL domain-containing protein [Myxococcales bacterium]
MVRKRRQRSPTGRAASAGILRRLRAALESGQAYTYAELARDAKCSQRTVRNYLDVAEEVMALPVVRTLGPDRRVRVELLNDGEPSIDALSQRLAAGMLRNLFPIEGTSLDIRKRPPRVQLVVSARGAYQYSELQLRTLRAWLRAADERPRIAVRFRYRSPSAEPGLRVVWPLGVVIRDLAHVYLAGVPAEAQSPRDVRTYLLERVESRGKGRAIDVLRGADATRPPDGLDRVRVESAIDLPFSMFPADEGDAVTVRVRVCAEQAPYIVGRRWHSRQKIRRFRDGEVEIRFGPANRREVEAWVRQWGDGVLEWDSA